MYGSGDRVDAEVGYGLQYSGERVALGATWYTIDLVHACRGRDCGSRARLGHERGRRVRLLRRADNGKPNNRPGGVDAAC